MADHNSRYLTILFANCQTLFCEFHTKEPFSLTNISHDHTGDGSTDAMNEGF